MKVDTVWFPVPGAQSLAVSTTSAASSAVPENIYAARLCASVAVSYRVASGTPVAVSADTTLPANNVEYIEVQPGQKIAALAAASGTLSITWLTH